MLVTMKEMLADAREKHYAVPGFDVSNYDMIKAVMDVCEEERSPALFMCLKPDMQNRGINFITAMLKEAASTYTVPVCIHLDHATEFADIRQAIEMGFASVMYDGSVLPFEQNAENTRQVCEYAHAHDVSVEAELGHVGDGIAGTSDGKNEDAAAADHPEDSLTDPKDVEHFIDMWTRWPLPSARCMASTAAHRSCGWIGWTRSTGSAKNRSFCTAEAERRMTRFSRQSHWVSAKSIFSQRF